MKRKLVTLLLTTACTASLLTGCSKASDDPSANVSSEIPSEAEQSDAEDSTEKKPANPAIEELFTDIIDIQLSDEEILINGTAAATDASAAVYTANDIVFYLEGQDFTYGEGEASDEHSQEEADAHTVVHITKPGAYRLNGSLSAGQVAIDLGEDAEDDPAAVVNLILDNVDITCSVAPAIIFYEVYECGSDDEDDAAKDVDTTAAGANVYIADDSVNNITGSHVARIYKSVELNEEGTEVIDGKKLHKYDAAFYSKKTLNMNGDAYNTGILNILADNEGLDSELHLTINGGNINIESGNDGINTNEDGISVTTINGGNLHIYVNGSTGEGDGIDSNGWLVINGGTVTTSACDFSADAGIDSDMGIHINGGMVAATGNMLDRISESARTYVVFQFSQSQEGGKTYTLKNGNDIVYEYTPENGFMYMILSGAGITEGTYTLWCGDTQSSGYATEGDMGGFPGGMGNFPGGFEGEMPEGMEIPEGMEFPDNFEGQMPEGMEIPEGMERPGNFEGQMPEGMKFPDNFQGQMPGGMEFPDDFDGQIPEGMEIPDDFGGRGQEASGEASTEFQIVLGGNYFIVM